MGGQIYCIIYYKAIDSVCKFDDYFCTLLMCIYIIVLIQLMVSLDLVALRQKQTSAEQTSAYHTAEERTSLMAKINSYNEGQSPAHQIKLVYIIML